MNTHLEALKQNVIADTVAEYTDFVFTLTTDPHGNLTIDYRGEWQQHRNPNFTDIPFIRLHTTATSFLSPVTGGMKNRPYKTLKGAVKYVNAELRESCDNVRKQKEKDDQEKAFEEKSVQILREFHDAIIRNGINAKLRLKADRYQNNHVSVDISRLNTEVDISVTSDYRLQIYFPYPRCYTSPETAIDVLSALSQKGSA